MLIEENSKLEYLIEDNQSKKAIILLHGYGANAQDLFGLSDYLNKDKEFSFIAINAPIKLQLSPFFDSRAWFPIDEQQLMNAQMNNEHRLFRDQFPPEMENSLSLLTKCIQSLMDKYNFNKIILGGFSQGAMMSMHFAFSYPLIIEKVILYSAGYIGEQQLREKLENFKNHFSVLQSHGESDQVLSFNEAKDLYSMLKEKDVNIQFYPFPGVHEIPLNIINKSVEFLSNT